MRLIIALLLLVAGVALHAQAPTDTIRIPGGTYFIGEVDLVAPTQGGDHHLKGVFTDPAGIYTAGAVQPGFLIFDTKLDLYEVVYVHDTMPFLEVEVDKVATLDEDYAAYTPGTPSVGGGKAVVFKPTANYRYIPHVEGVNDLQKSAIEAMVFQAIDEDINSGGAGQNIYTTDDTISSNRTVSGMGRDITWDSLNQSMTGEWITMTLTDSAYIYADSLVSIVTPVNGLLRLVTSGVSQGLAQPGYFLQLQDNEGTVEWVSANALFLEPGEDVDSVYWNSGYTITLIERGDTIELDTEYLEDLVGGMIGTVIGGTVQYDDPGGVINYTMTGGGSGSGVGEANLGLNLGDGAEVYATKLDTTLRFRTLVSTNSLLALSQNDTTIRFTVDPLLSSYTNDAGFVTTDTSGSVYSFGITDDTLTLVDQGGTYNVSLQDYISTMHADGDILWVSEDGDNATAVKGDMHLPYADPWTAQDNWTDGDLIYVVSGTYDFGPTGSGATYEFADIDEANLFDGVNDGEVITYYFAANTSVVKTTPFDFSLATTKALFYADTSATYRVYGHGIFEVDATNANTSVVQVDDPDAVLEFHADEIRARTFGFAIYQFDDVFIDVERVRQARVGDVALISFRERSNQTGKKFTARVDDYNNFPGNSHFSGIISTRCCGTDIEFTDSDFSFQFGNITKYDPLGVTGGAAGSDVGYVFGLVHDSQLHNSTWSVSANNVRYYDLGTGVAQSNDSTSVLSGSYISQPAICVGASGLDNSTVSYDIGLMVSDFPCIGVNWQASGTSQSTEGRIYITGDFVSTNTYAIIYDQQAGVGTDSTKTITYTGNFSSLTHPVIGDRRGTTNRARMVYKGATLGSFVGNPTQVISQQMVVQTDSISVYELGGDFKFEDINGYTMLNLSLRDTTGNSISFYGDSYSFINESPSPSDTSVMVWIAGNPAWILKSAFGGSGSGPGTDTSGYNISFGLDGDSIRLVDGGSNLAVPMDSINRKTSWYFLIYGNSLSIGFEDSTDVGFEYVPNLFSYNQETKEYEPAIADTNWVQNPPGGFTNIPRLQLTEQVGAGSGAERCIRHGNPTYWAAVQFAKDHPNDTIFLSYGSRGGVLSDSLINEFYLDTLSTWIDDMALAGGTYFDYVVFGGGPQETSPEFQANMVKYFEWLRDTKGVIDEKTLFLIQSTSNNAELNSVIETLSRNRTQYKIVPGADAFATLDGVHLTAQGHKSLGLTMYQVIMAGQEQTLGDTLMNVGLGNGGVSIPGSEGNLLYLPSHPDDNQTDSMDWNIMFITGMNTVETVNYVHENVITVSNPSSTDWILNDQDGLVLYGTHIMYDQSSLRDNLIAFGDSLTTTKNETNMFGRAIDITHTGVGAFGSNWTSGRNFEYFFGEQETNYFTFGPYTFDFSTALTASEDGYGLYFDFASGEFKVEAPPSGGGGVTDHGALTGLIDDDHPQYLLLAGRSGGQEITTVNPADVLLTLEGISSQTGDYLAVDSAGVRKVTIAQDGSIEVILDPEDATPADKIKIGLDPSTVTFTTGTPHGMIGFAREADGSYLNSIGAEGANNFFVRSREDIYFYNFLDRVAVFDSQNGHRFDLYGQGSYDSLGSEVYMPIFNGSGLIGETNFQDLDAATPISGNSFVFYNGSSFKHMDWDDFEAIDHDALTNYVANEHIDWTADQGATNINSGNYDNIYSADGTLSGGRSIAGGGNFFFLTNTSTLSLSSTASSSLTSANQVSINAGSDDGITIFSTGSFTGESSLGMIFDLDSDNDGTTAEFQITANASSTLLASIHEDGGLELPLLPFNDALDTTVVYNPADGKLYLANKPAGAGGDGNGIYDGSDALPAGTTTVTMGSNDLEFSGTAGSSFNVSGQDFITLTSSSSLTIAGAVLGASIVVNTSDVIAYAPDDIESRADHEVDIFIDADSTSTDAAFRVGKDATSPLSASYTNLLTILEDGAFILGVTPTFRSDIDTIVTIDPATGRLFTAAMPTGGGGGVSHSVFRDTLTTTQADATATGVSWNREVVLGDVAAVSFTGDSITISHDGYIKVEFIANFEATSAMFRIDIKNLIYKDTGSGPVLEHTGDTHASFNTALSSGDEIGNSTTALIAVSSGDILTFETFIDWPTSGGADLIGERTSLIITPMD
jgi:hypothetical protein